MANTRGPKELALAQAREDRVRQREQRDRAKRARAGEKKAAREVLSPQGEGE